MADDLAAVPGGSFNDYELFRWLIILKQFVEDNQAGTMTFDATQITTGVFSEARIPTLPWARISKVGSSLADLATRSASALNSGILAQAYGGTGRATAYQFAVGTFSVASGSFAIVLSRMTIGQFDRVTVYGTGRVGVL